jgi:lactate permease
VLSAILAVWSSPWWVKGIEGRHEELDEGRVSISRCVIPWWPSAESENARNSAGNSEANGGSGLTLPIISRVSLAVPGLDRQIYRNAPVVPVPEGAGRAAKPERAVFDLNWLSAVGTSIFVAALFSAWWLRIGAGDFARQFGETLWSVRWAMFTIACTLALAFIIRYSGLDGTLGLAFTKTGCLYPFFAPLLGWLGVALTGSDTSSNALFGSLQRITADRLGLNSVLVVTANSTGGVMGKMVSAQTIVVAAAATDQTGQEGRILRFVLLHSILLACLVGLLTLLQAYALSWTVPVLPR